MARQQRPVPLETKREYNRRYLAKVAADPVRAAKRRQQQAEAMARLTARLRDEQAHPCPRCGRIAYLSVANRPGRYPGLCQPCAVALDDMANGRIGLLGKPSVHEPLSFEELRWERDALDTAYLPRLADRLHRNRGFDVDVITSWGPD